MRRPLAAHPVAALFPDLNPTDFAALREDIRAHGVKIPILLHGGQILDGRQRYRACQELGIRCPFVEWNGHDPWLEVQSRNLLRRQLAKEQVYAIRKLAAREFPEIAAMFDAERAQARARRAQAKGKPRGQKAALLGSWDRGRPSADAIGARIGVSGSTVKRVDRLERQAPHLLPKVAAGEMTVKHALRLVAKASSSDAPAEEPSSPASFSVEAAASRLQQLIRQEWIECPREQRATLVRSLQQQLHKLQRLSEDAGGLEPRRSHPVDMHEAVGMAGLRMGDPIESGALRMAAGLNDRH
jgi:hypothetical protein